MRTVVTLFFALLIIFTWAPWVDESFISETLTEKSQLEASENPASESCMFQKIISKSRTAFGYNVEAEYACFTPEPMKRNMFVSSFGTSFPLNKLRPVKPDELYGVFN